MNFRRHLETDEPDINLIPLIDVLLVILIFLAASTSFSRFSQLSVRLPDAAAQSAEAAAGLTVTVAADGRYALNGKALPIADADQLSEALRKAAAGRDDPSLVIDADAAATHQAVVRAMEAAGRAGISRIGFTTQAAPAGSGR
ncbi:MAG: biopolymer transporter ExbD [Bordetella sp. SCN 67-23]|nr:biopolymer transporter ExbD [Burkholderiales bacterium]ODS70536.1 MAG: biopolymer transporter ExbD [Bordetella sp. SCN 67-23]ODU91733.1 MAG: biopolymer transporter ExbD [Bordetella sp. SCN 68-11]OJW88235.1 MAG: biopolymer transporter ExbD [Burkholderiales bacterium 67-32]